MEKTITKTELNLLAVTEDTLLIEQMASVANLGLTTELIGSWIWVSGDTKSKRNELKSLGFLWNPTRGKWFFREVAKCWKGRNSTFRTEDEIKGYFGCLSVQ